MARKRKASILLNNQRFFIRPGSYQRVIAPITIPKFSTGDITYSDLSSWQFWAQSDWDNAFQFFYDGSGGFFGGLGVDTISRKGQIRKGPKVALVSAGAICSRQPQAIVLGNLDALVNHNPYVLWQNGISAMAGNISGIGFGFKVHQTSYAVASAGMNSLIGDSVYRDTGTYFTNRKFIQLISGGVITTPIATPGNAIIWSNPVILENRIYVIIAQNQLQYYDLATGTWSEADTVTLPKVSTFFNGQYRLEVKNNKIFIIVRDDSGDISVFVHDTNTTSLIGVIGSGSGINNGTGNWTAVDKENIYICYKELGTWRDIIVRFNESTFSTIFDGTSPAVIGLHFDNIFAVPKGIFLSVNDNGNQVGYLMDSQGKFKPYFEQRYESSTFNAVAPIRFLYWKYQPGNNIFFANNASHEIGFIDTIGYDYDTQAGRSYIESSIIDFDLFNIDKYFGGFTIYHQPLPAGSTITLKVKIDNASSYTTIGSNSVAGSVSFDVQMISGNIGKKIQYRLDLDTSTTANAPTIEDIIIRYILQPVVKRKWVMDLLISGDIEEYTSRRTAKELDAELWNAIKKGVVKFTDIDGITYDASKSGTTDRGILISDCREIGPFPFGESGPEFVAQLEIIEG